MNVKKYLSLLLAGTAILCSGWSKDGELPWRRIDDSLVTPHRTFANPVSGKKLSAIILANGIGAREIVELKQRFEYDYELWPLLSRKIFSPFTVGHDGSKVNKRPYALLMSEEDYKGELEKLLAAMRKSDLIILGKHPFDAVPTDIRNKMLDHVKQGAGMIIITFDGEDQNIKGFSFKPVSIDFPTEKLPALAGVKVKVAAHGKGKIMVINYKKNHQLRDGYLMESLTPYECDDPLYYDYYHAFLGKCMWYLKDPARKVISKVSADGKILLSRVPAGSSISYVVADVYGKEIAGGKLKAQKNVSVSLKNLPASARMLDVKVLDKAGKTIDFAVTPISIKTVSSIKAIALPKDGFKPDEIISGKVELTAPVKGKIQLSAKDNRGKIIYQENIAINGKSAGFTAKILHQKSAYAVLSAKLIANGKLLDEACENIYFNTTDDVSDFAFGMWSYATSYSRVEYLWLKEMNKWGVDNVMDCHMMFAPVYKAKEAPRKLKRAGMNCAYYLHRVVGDHWIKYWNYCGYGFWEKYQKNGSIYDKNGKTLDRGVTSDIKIVEAAKDIGVLFYNLGDENCLSLREKDENCFCKDCQRRFRAYLKREHGTIENLNKNYGSKYKSFEEITAKPFPKSVEAGQYCEWLDFHMFMEEQFIDWHRYLKAKIRSVDPEARVGLEGMVYPFSSFTGFNLYKMMPYFEFCAPYYCVRDAKAILQYMPANSKRGVVRSAWFGAYEGEMKDQFVQQPPWRYLFGGLGGAFYWFSGAPTGVGGFTTSGINGPDLRMLRQFTKAAEEVNLIKESGVGKLLINSQLRDDQILVHYSNNSLHASTLYPDKSTWEISHTDMQGLLGSLGLGYRYISPPELEKGVPAKTKVIFLPYSQAMSPKEVENLRQFVKRGGMLIADHNPAFANQHGRWLDKSQLADVFGKFKKMNINRYGKGYAVYLDDYLSGVNARIMKNQASGIQNGILRILSKAGVKPFASVIDSDDKIREVALFDFKNTTYVCMLAQRSVEGEKRVSAVGAEGGASANTAVGGSFTRKVTLLKPMHVYDIMNKKYLGKIKEFTVELEPAVGRVFACKEELAKVPGVSVKGMFSRVTRGEAVEFRLSNVDNTAIVTITDPDGKVADVQRVTTNRARFVPAYNDKTGTWKVSVRDVVSGLSSETAFTVK